MSTPEPIITDLEKAAAILRRGDLLALPTETVYGLAGDARDDRVVAKIYAAKGRPSFNPLIVHAADTHALRRLGVFNAVADALAKKFWPGPLTMVLPMQPNAGIARLVTANLPTIALRIPAHPMTQALLRRIDFPLAAPSANPSGRISPTTAQHVANYFSADSVAGILDGGPCAVGLESTIIDLSGDVPRILRPGRIGIADLRALLPMVSTAQPDDAVTAPGMLAQHYAPRVPLRLGYDNPCTNEALLAFGPDIPHGFKAVVNLSTRGDVIEAAANLYAALHALDQPEKYNGIATMSLPETDLGQAIHDRLRRAAHTGGSCKT